ncbi:MAG TPA: response regulator [Gemmatimonadaceae bacterium]|nr:response regulator [Gemmatimonadaceae bacterium]
MDQQQAGLDGFPTGRRGWIAVVDDDPSIRSSLARLLRSEGIVVETFAGSSDFLAAIASDGAPACLVLDVHLGAESGFALQEILAVTHANMPVILMTGHDKISSAELARRTGPDGFLRKPFDGDLILGMVRRRAELVERPA